MITDFISIIFTSKLWLYTYLVFVILSSLIIDSDGLIVNRISCYNQKYSSNRNQLSLERNIAPIHRQSSCLNYHRNYNKQISSFSSSSTALHMSSSVSTANTIFDDLSVHLYDLQLFISNNLESSFANPSLVGCILLLGAGLLSSLSPCALSMIPLTSIYLSSNDNRLTESDTSKNDSTNINNNSNNSNNIIINSHTSSNGEDLITSSPTTSLQNDRDTQIIATQITNTNTNTVQVDDDKTYRLIKSLLYASGIAFTFTLLGYIASLTGQFIATSTSDGSDSGTSIFKNISSLFTAVFTIFMGLNVLEIVNLSIFSSNFDFSSKRKSLNLPWQIEPIVFGATTALVLSPCSSPVLASLLALVSVNSQNSNNGIGIIYLFFYSLGYATPTILAVNSSINFIKSLQASSYSQYINMFFGSILIIFGTYYTLDTISKSLLMV